MLTKFFKKMPNRRGHKARGFTLIELLIVIAIILILIAIALPNFLEAQIRAKITRAKGEIRTLAFAMEAYYLDFNTYPAETEGNFGSNNRNETGHSWLTSPIAYITSVPEDPFAGQSASGELRTYESGGIEKGDIYSCVPCMETWVIYSSGPNENPEPSIRSADPHHTNHVITYTPTNGTRSAGTIHWYGGDPFWIGVRLANLANKGDNRANASSFDVGLPVDGQIYLHRLPPHLM